MAFSSQQHFVTVCIVCLLATQADSSSNLGYHRFAIVRVLLQVVVGAAVCGAVYAGLAYFKKDQDVGDSFHRFGNNVENDARGTSRKSPHELLVGSVLNCVYAF